MKLQAIIAYVQNSPDLEQGAKDKYLALLSKAGITSEEVHEILDELEDILQDKIDQSFAQMGIVLDENDPEYQKEHQAMLDGIESAEQEFSSTMDALDKEATQLEKDTVKQIDDVQIQAVRDSIE